MSLYADDVWYRNSFWRLCSVYVPQMCVGMFALGFIPPPQDLGSGRQLLLELRDVRSGGRGGCLDHGPDGDGASQGRCG